MSYLSNLHNEMIKANHQSRTQVLGWDNKKRKTRNRMTPRGPFFKRLEESYYKNWWAAIKKDISILKEPFLNS